jgi:hypothetical protein
MPTISGDGFPADIVVADMPLLAWRIFVGIRPTHPAHLSQ